MENTNKKIGKRGIWRIKNPNAPISKTHGKSGTPEYYIWNQMKQRCKNTNMPNYKYYGGRGITFCKEWEKFEAFYQDMGNRPSKLYSLERINVDGNYCKENCKWATWEEQAKNKRKIYRGPLYLHNGEERTLKNWADIYGLSKSIIRQRLNKLEWTLEKALNTPARYKRITN